MGTSGFIWQEAIDGLEAGKDAGRKLHFQKLNLAAWIGAGKDKGGGDQVKSREETAKTRTPGEGDRTGKDAWVQETVQG